MANSEVALDVEHLQEEKTHSSVVDGRSKLETTATAKSAAKDGGDTMRKWPSFNTIFNPKGKFLMIWNNVFVISCVLALLVDPLFLYIPITNQDMKCIGLDQNLKIVTLFLRSAVDLPCIVNISSQILAVSSPGSQRRRRQWRRFKLAEHALEMAKLISWSWRYLLIDILAILPIPQVVILILLTRTTGSKSLNARKFLNSLVIFQYVPRAFRMYRSCKEANKTPDNWNGYTLCLKVYKFILASHVLGALWYYFSAQREMDCWQYACRSQKECEASTFDCGGTHTLKNVTFLNDLCPVNIPNSTLFNFGIFLDVLQSGTMGSTDFPQKILQCFWWGLRSLSSFGQNLETSTYAWENLFALCISITGMILFLIYLNAILQFATARSEKFKRINQEEKEKEKTEKLSRKMKMKNLEVDWWLYRKDLPGNLKVVIMHIIQEKLEQNKDVEVENILSVLPSSLSKYIKRYLRLAVLKKVPMLQTMGVKLLTAICEHLEPVDYTEDSCIIGEGGRLNKMIFITHGTVRTYKTNGKGGKIGSNFLEKGDFYGADELLTWASKFSSFDDLPTSMRMVKPVTKVEAFELSANDLQSVAIKYWWHFTKNKELTDFNDSLLEEFAVASIEKEIRRRRQGKKKHSIRSLNKLSINQGSASKRLQQVISEVMRDQLPSPVCALDRN